MTLYSFYFSLRLFVLFTREAKTDAWTRVIKENNKTNTFRAVFFCLCDVMYTFRKRDAQDPYMVVNGAREKEQKKIHGRIKKKQTWLA